MLSPGKRKIEVPVQIRDGVEAASKVRAIVVEAESSEEAVLIVAAFARSIRGKNIQPTGPDK